MPTAIIWGALKVIIDVSFILSSVIWTAYSFEPQTSGPIQIFKPI